MKSFVTVMASLSLRLQEVVVEAELITAQSSAVSEAAFGNGSMVVLFFFDKYELCSFCKINSPMHT